MNTKLAIAVSLALALGACATIAQPDPALASARETVRAAEANPNVALYAALDLKSAKDNLATAESASLTHKDAQVAQSAYLATQSARMAQAHAAGKADDARVAAGQAERDQIRLAARTSEVQSAKAATSAALGQRDEANAESSRLQAEVDRLNAKPTPRGLILTLSDVLFDTGRAELNPSSGRKMDQLAQFLTDYPNRRVQIDGFTDNVGTDSYNLDLSQRRADSVRSALLSRGIDSTRVTTQGYAKAYPVASNADSGGRQLNRRVEVVIGGENNSEIAPRT